LKSSKLLWQNIRLPIWSAQRLYKLYQRHVAGEATEEEKQEYAGQLMVYVAANVARGRWFASLRRCRLDAEDVAADLLLFLLRKTPSIRLDYPCVKVLLKVLNVAIHRRLLSEVRKQKLAMETLHDSDWGNEDGSRLARAASSQTPFIEHLERAMREAEESICRGHWTDQLSICILFRYLCRQVVWQNTILTYSQLPRRLSRRISLEEHAIIAYRLNRFIRQFAEACL
jgi:hypothetical protein